MNITNEEILEMSKQCGVMKHYFRDELLTFARLIEQRQGVELERLRKIEAAVKNLISVKGRYHSEQAYQALVEVLK